MLITTTQELRLAFPAHAIDDISPLSGFLENSELDFLKIKLGKTLYKKLCAYYKDVDISAYVQNIQDKGTDFDDEPYARLLCLSQRAIAFDGFSRAIDVQAVSLSNMGVNVATTDDYGAPTKENLSDFKKTCIKEAHISVNLILELLEDFCRESVELSEKTEQNDAEKAIVEIADAWKDSRYYFIAGGLLIPTADILQQYVDFYDNREKFIQMLPDLHYIQDELIAPLIGEDFCENLVKLSHNGTDNKDLARIITRLRKCEAAYLEERTSVITVSKDRKQKAHDEGERHIHAAVNFCAIHQADLEEAKIDGIFTAPWYVSADSERPEPQFKNNAEGNAIFVLPAMN